MYFVAKILAADIIDIKPQLKQKKAEDKEKKTDDKIQGMQPMWDKAKLRVMESSAYAGGYELTVDVPTPASFFKSKEGGWDAFVKQLHPFIHERIGKWMDRPYVKKDARAKQGMINAQAMWPFDDAFLAYALGLDLTEWRVSKEVVDKNKISSRMLLAEKAFKEMSNFRAVSKKKLKLRTQSNNEQDKIWKEEFMPEWVKLTDKWKEQGIAYHALRESKVSNKDAAMGFYQKIQSRYVIVTTSDF